ncbi:MAG: hypothetical protein ACLQDM_27375 [Bradyrhizobium sp.]
MVTGPKTASGRSKSSRNAFRHGLSLPLPPDSETSAKAEAMARVLIRDHADEDQLLAATDLASGDLEHLRRLTALDHYERLAHTKRRPASRKL